MAGEKEVSVIIRAKDAVAGGLASSKKQITEWASGIGGIVTGALAGLSLGAFVSRAVDEVSGAERAVTQLSNSLGNIGVDFQKVKPNIDAAVASLQKVAAIDDDDAIASLNRLVQLSGNYKKSLENLPLVADVAAAKNIDLADAAERVGKIMAGTGAKALKDFGITTKDASAAIDELREKVKGAAETELHTLGGSLKAANVAFGDVAQGIGEVVAQSPAFQSFMQFAIGGLKDFSGNITANKGVLTGWLATVFAAVREVGKLIDAIVSVAVYGIQAINGAGEAAAGFLTRNSERQANGSRMLSAAMENLHGVTFSFGDAWDHVASAADNATSVQTAGLKRTREELEKNKRAHDALIAAQKAEADAAEAKKAAEERARLEAKKDSSIGMWEKAGTLPQYRGQAVAALNDLKHEAEFLLQGNVPLARKLELMERLAKVQEALSKLGAGPSTAATDMIDGRFAPIGGKAGVDAFGRGVESDIDARNRAFQEQLDRQKEQPGGLGQSLGINGAGPDMGFMSNFGKSIEEQTGPATGAIESLGKAFTDITAGPLLNFGDAIAVSMETLVSGSGNAGKAFLSSMVGAIKGVAAVKGKLFAGEALGSLAAGFMGHPGGFAAAAKYGAAAALLFAVAGAAGGLSGAGGGGASSPAAASQSSQSALEKVDAGKLTVVWPGRSKSVLDAADPEDQDAIMEMLKKLAGNRNIDIVFPGA